MRGFWNRCCSLSSRAIQQWEQLINDINPAVLGIFPMWKCVSLFRACVHVCVCVCVCVCSYAVVHASSRFFGLFEELNTNHDTWAAESRYVWVRGGGKPRIDAKSNGAGKKTMPCSVSYPLRPRHLFLYRDRKKKNRCVSTSRAHIWGNRSKYVRCPLNLR